MDFGVLPTYCRSNSELVVLTERFFLMSFGWDPVRVACLQKEGDSILTGYWEDTTADI